MATIDKRPTSDGTISYRARVRLKGHPAQVGSFNRLTDAKKWIQQTEAAIREGRHFKTSAAKKHTLSEAIDRYIKLVLPKKPKSAAIQEPQLKWWKKELGDYSLADVSTSLISESIEKLIAGESETETGISRSTANRYLAILSHLFTIASNEWEWIEHNPVKRVGKSKEPRGRQRFLSDEERTELLSQCKTNKNPNLYPVVILAISTGMRRGEILSLKWEDVDLNRGRIYLQETKNGERRGVPVAGRALEILKKHQKVKKVESPFVFPSSFSPKTGKPIDIRAAWESALEKAKIQDFRFHDLRHSCASYLAMNGATLAEIAEVLGHKTLSMVKRYAHLSDSHTSSVVARMNKKIFG